MVKLLIDRGADVNTVDMYGRTPLHNACINSHLDMVQLLIDRGADVNVADRYGVTPLSLTFRYRHLHLLPILRQAYIQQQLITPPQLTSFPNYNVFSTMKVESSRYLHYYLTHRMSSLEIRGYMDKVWFVRNGLRELVARFPSALSLEEYEGRECGYRILISKWFKKNEVCLALLCWESEGGFCL